MKASGVRGGASETASSVRPAASAWTHLALLAALPIAACDGDDGSPDGGSAASLAGLWVLASVDGEPLPAFASQDGAATLVVHTGALQLNEDQTFVEAYELWRVENPDSSDVHLAASGAWSRDDDALRLAIPPNSGLGDSLILFWSVENDRLVNELTGWGPLVFERNDDD